MDIEEDRSVFLRVFDPLFHLVGLGVAFEVNDIAAVFLQGEDLLDGGMPPFGRLHGAFRPAPARPTAAPVVGGIDHAIGGKLCCRFCQPVPLQRHAVDPAHYLGSLRLYHPKAGIVRVFDITVGRRRKRNACIAFHLVHDPALLGNVFRIILVEHTSFGKVKRKQQKSSIHAGLRRDGSRSDTSLSDGQGAEITIA